MTRYFVVKDLPYKFPWYGRMSLDLWIPLKQFVYKRDMGICQYCKTQFRYEKTHCHHTFELYEGGTNHPSNLKTLCIGCHKNRHPFMLKEM